jgi:anti-sigma factor RsiW
VISVFVWTDGRHDEAMRDGSRRGFQYVTWTHEGMTFVAVSDLNATELRELAQAFTR